MLSSPSSSLTSPSSFAGPSFLPLFRAKIDFFAVFGPCRGRMLGVRSAKIESLGIFVPSGSRIRAGAGVTAESLKVFDPPRSRIRGGRKWRKNKIFLKAGQDDQREAFTTDRRSMDVEAEIYEFMRMSDKPMSFPTKKELIAAGRADLVEAAAALGGWLTYGWDVDGDELHDGLEDCRVYQERVHQRNGSLASYPESNVCSAVTEENDPASEESVSDVTLANEPTTIPNSEDHLSTPSSSGRPLQTKSGTVDGGGIEGILSRLEKERYWTISTSSGGKAVNGRDSWRNALDDPGDTILVAHKLDIHNERNSKSESSESKTCFSNNAADVLQENGKRKDVNGTSSMPDTWRSWSLQRAGFSMTDFEAAEIATDDRNTLEDDPSNVEQSSSKILEQGQNLYESQDELKELSVDKNQIRLQLQHLEADLNNHLLQSRVNGVASRNDRENSIDELNRLSDVWEFQETEIMKAQNQLRSIRAKLAVLEGKFSLDIMEAKKLAVEKQKIIDTAEKGSLLLRTVCIVWRGSASEVLFAGSFNGWTRKIRMEKSDSGFFSVQLRLYPGRYEIKFIVDGIWQVDSLLPVVLNDGHENNLLFVE